MDNIEICSLPKIKFALGYSSDSYDNFLPPEEDFIEITYIYEGSMTVESDGFKEVAEKGDILVNLFGSGRRISTDSFQEHRTVGAYVKWRENSEVLYPLLLPNITKADKNVSSIHRLIDELIHDVYFYKNSPANGAEKFLELLCEISDYNKKHNSLGRSSDRLYTHRAKEFISENIHRSFTLGEIAENLSITPEYLCTIFKKSEGISLIKYANTVKLQGVKSLMEKENLRLYEAAAHFGFSDPNYVSRIYRQYFGSNITK